MTRMDTDPTIASELLNTGTIQRVAVDQSKFPFPQREKEGENGTIKVADAANTTEKRVETTLAGLGSKIKGKADEIAKMEQEINRTKLEQEALLSQVVEPLSSDEGFRHVEQRINQIIQTFTEAVANAKTFVALLELTFKTTFSLRNSIQETLQELGLNSTLDEKYQQKLRAILWESCRDRSEAFCGITDLLNHLLLSVRDKELDEPKLSTKREQIDALLQHFGFEVPKSGKVYNPEDVTHRHEDPTFLAKKHDLEELKSISDIKYIYTLLDQHFDLFHADSPENTEQKRLLQELLKENVAKLPQ